MKLAVIANPVLQAELSDQGVSDTGVEWHAELEGIEDADAIIDLLFTPGPDRIELLQHSGARLYLVNHVAGKTSELPEHFIRINGWTGFLAGHTVEYATASGEKSQPAEDLLAVFNKKGLAVPDQPGFISARIVSMIINEAYLALEENVSSREDIDKAMKLGTNYPFGPFEWAEKIGLRQVHGLLQALAEKNPAYKPSALLNGEAAP
jgi:3-hydroxybutyryl-CoA dehydrogenase